MAFILHGIFILNIEDLLIQMNRCIASFCKKNVYDYIEIASNSKGRKYITKDKSICAITRKRHNSKPFMFLVEI